jgi:PBP4 family serine-type D-alanyl-D-alanine carboxypeptidase
MRRLLLLALLSGIWSPAAAQVAVSAQMEEWYGKAVKAAPGLWGVVVADQDGNVLWSVNASEPMTPASTVKVLTTGFARTMVGPEARQPTRVVGVGAVDPTDGTWRGNWALELNGDPTFGRNDNGGVTFHDLAAQLRAIGVRKLSGPLQLTTLNGSARSTYPTVWPSRHRGRYYAPPIGPITINENLVAFTVSPGPGRSKPVITYDDPVGSAALVTVEARTVAGKTNRLTIRTSGNGWVVSGTIGQNAPARRYTFVAHNPTAVVEAAWDAALARAGIEWDRQSDVPGIDGPARILAEVASPSFDEIAAEVNRRSVNLGAELMLRWGGGVQGAPARLEQHVKEVTGLTTGIHPLSRAVPADTGRSRLPAAAAGQRHRHPPPARHRRDSERRGARQDRQHQQHIHPGRLPGPTGGDAGGCGDVQWQCHRPGPPAAVATVPGPRRGRRGDPAQRTNRWRPDPAAGRLRVVDSLSRPA